MAAEVVALEAIETANGLRSARDASPLIYLSCKAEELHNWESEPLIDLLYFE